MELLSKILDRPSDFRVHIMRYATSIASSIAYGLRFPSADDPDIKNLIEVSTTLCRNILHGALLTGDLVV